MIERSIDLNVDLGEGGPDDAALIALASSANIACGGHAGDEWTMRAAIDACLRHGVAIGAHPGHEDPEYFGRRALELPPEQIRDALLRQLERFTRLADRIGATPHHVKLHGALYHQAVHDSDLARSLAAAIANILPGCLIYTPAASALAAAAPDCGLTVIPEGFADRRYTAVGKLIARHHPGAVITEIEAAVSQALEITHHHHVRTIEGIWLALPARTLCIHGDHPQALKLLHTLATTLALHGFPLKPP